MARAGDETCRIWDPFTGQEIGPPTKIADGFPRHFGRGGQFGDHFATSRDGRWKAMADKLNDVKVVEATTGPGDRGLERAYRPGLVSGLQPRWDADRHGELGLHDQALGDQEWPGGAHAAGPYGRCPLRGVQPGWIEARLGEHRQHGANLGCNPDDVQTVLLIRKRGGWSTPSVRSTRSRVK